MKSRIFKNKLILFIFLILLTSVFSCKEAQKNEVDKLFAKWDKPDSPGCALGIIKDGKFIYKRGYGMANLEYSIPITSRTILRIGSTSKQFTAMCILLLEEQGKLSVDDDIRKHLPEIPEYEKPITIRHLIHHISGIRDYLTLMDIAGARGDDFYTDPEVVDLLARQKELNFMPGEEHLYSNSGYFLLSEIVKKVTGKSMRVFAEENIFKPLGMKNTHFHDDHTMVVKNRASGYSPRKKDGFRINMTTLDMIGDGGVFTSVDDLYFWDQNFYSNKLGKGSQDLINRLLTVGVLNSGKKLDYGFGIAVTEYRGLKMVSHGGAFVGFRADMIRFPEQKFSVIVLANLGAINPSRLARKVADIYLVDYFKEEKKAPSEKPKFVKLSEAELKEKTGAFYNKSQDRFLKVTLKEGKLFVDVFSFRFQIKPVSQTRFMAVEAPIDQEIEFEKQDEGKPMLLYMLREEGKPSTYEAVRFVTPTPAQLAEYEGDYFSEELQVAYKIILDTGKLFLRHENPHKSYPKEPLEPTFKDRFILSRFQLKFFRNKQKEATSFTVNAGRVKNIRFVKK
jgi:CubicO group peptidase (beta-lactamase class C family)